MDKQQSQSLFDRITKPQKYLYYAQFFLMGLITNFGSILILTGAQNLSRQLDMNNFMGFYTFSVIICSSMTRIINSRFCLRVSYLKRIIGLSCYLFLGYMSLFTVLSLKDKLNNVVAFCLTLIPSFIMGTGFAFGETTNLGYLRMFPKDLVAGWGSGIGCAGIIASTLNLIVKVNDIKLKTLYLFVSPVTVLYALNFYFITVRFTKDEEVVMAPLIQPEGEENKDRDKDKEDTNIIVHVNEVDEVKPISGNVNGNGNEKEQQTSSTTANRLLTFANAKEAFKMSYKLIINLALVHFMEVTTLNGLSERVTHRDYIKDEFFKKCMFESFALCFQLGHFISRTSLAIVKHITFVEIFFICQIVVATLWIFEYYYGFITIVYVLHLILIILGILGGSTYVASFYFILNSKDIDPSLKELSVNLATIANDIGTLLSSLTILLIANVIMVEK